jgi:hypothetical protein
MLSWNLKIQENKPQATKKLWILLKKTPISFPGK